MYDFEFKLLYGLSYNRKECNECLYLIISCYVWGKDVTNGWFS